jgi:pimeloyl-ACP methyl ester carboxylesterase
MRTKPSAAALDDQIRIAEREVYQHYGLGPTERIVSLASPLGLVSVRLSIFGPDGASEPPVLLLHGIASVSALAASVIVAVPNRRVIAIDWPGHGLSGPSVLPPQYPVRRYVVGVLQALLDQLRIPEVDIVGHSMGGQFGLYAALDLPDRVRRLVVIGAPGAGFACIKPVPIMIALAIPRVGPRLLSLPMSIEAFVRNSEKPLGVGALREAPPELMRAAYLIGQRASYPSSVASYFRAMLRGGSLRRGISVPPKELATLRQPTLLVWGDDDVFAHPVDAATEIVAIRDSHLIRLADAGHAPWLQHPGLVGRAVADHLDAR